MQGGHWEAEKFRSYLYGVSLPATCPCHFRSGAAMQSGLEPIPHGNAGVEDSCAPSTRRGAKLGLFGCLAFFSPAL